MIPNMKSIMVHDMFEFYFFIFISFQLYLLTLLLSLHAIIHIII